MRAWILLLPLLILITGCPQPDEPEQSAKPVELTRQSLELDALGVSITEIARHSPPEGLVWPHALDYERRTLWNYSDSSPVLYTASAGEWIAPEDESEVPIRGPAKTYIWNLGDGSVSVTDISHELPAEINQPITVQSPMDLYPVIHVFSGSGGESPTQSVSIDDEEPVPIAIVDGFWSFNPQGEILYESAVSTAQHELYAGSVFTSLDGIDSWCLVYRELNKQAILVSEGDDETQSLTRLVDTWSYYDTTRGRLVLLANIVEKTGAARLDGFLDDPAWFFFSSDREYDEGPATYVVQGPRDMLVLAPFRISDDPGEIPAALRVTGYIPPVSYEDSHIVFFDLAVQEGNSTYIVAVKFDGENILDSNPSIIWSAEVPPIFGVSTVVYPEPTGRPYIVCLDPFTGDLTAFGPLTGAIRFQANIELADWHLGSPLASFCHYIDSRSMDSTILIHDPGANEIIEFEISTSSIGSPGAVTPLENPETEANPDD